MYQKYLGAELHIDNTVMNSEILPKNCLMYRKDRNIHGGGVFILAEESIPSSLIPTNTRCELVWVQLHTCTYYINKILKI